MENSLLFLGVGIAITAAALILARILRRNLRRKLPGADERRGGTHWYPGLPDEGNDGD